MATNTWQNGAVNHNWSTAGNWSLGHKPAAGEDVTMPNVAWACTLNESSANLNSFNQTGWANTMTWSAGFGVTVAPASGTVVCLFAGTNTISTTSFLNLNPASGAQVNLTAAGKLTSLRILTQNGAGTVSLQDNLTYSGSGTGITLTQGTWTTNNKNITGGSFVSNNANVRAITLGTSTLTLSGSSAWILFNSTNLTFSGASSTITCSNANALFDGGGQIYGTVNFTGAIAQIGGVNTFATLTKTAGATTDGVARFLDNQTVTTQFTMTGSTDRYRLWVGGQYARTSTGAVQNYGGQRTITLTGASVSCTNCYFTSIVMTPAQDLSAVTTIGNALNNSGITFCPAMDCYWHADGGNWWDAKWYQATNGGGGAARSPLAHDTAIFDVNSFDSASQSIVATIHGCKSMNWSNVTNTPTYTQASTSWFGGTITLVSGMTLTTGTNSFDLYADASNTCTFISGTKSIYRINSLALPTGSTVILGDAPTISNRLSVQAFCLGNFNDGGYNISGGCFMALRGPAIFTGSPTFLYITNDSAPTSNFNLSMGNGTWTLNRTSGSLWTSQTGDSVTAGNSTLILSDNGNSTKTFDNVANNTFNNLSITGGGTGAITFSGNSMLNDFTINAPKTVKLTSGSTTTVGGTPTMSGTLVNPITFNAVTPGSKAYFIIKNPATVSYVNATDIDSSGGRVVIDPNGVITTCRNWFTRQPAYPFPCFKP